VTRTELDPHDELMRELTRERYAPLLPPPKRLQPHARQADLALIPKRHPGARPTGTGWPT
jgi:hypothetical protein